MLTHSMKRIVTTLLLLLGPVSQSAFAQRPPGPESELLRRTEIHSELGLSDEQSQKLQDLQEKSTTSRDDFEQYRKDLEAAETDEAKTKVREEFSARVIKARTLFQDNAVDVLNDNQKASLRGLYLRTEGVRGLTNEDLAESYGVTEEQREKLVIVVREYRSAMRQIDDDVTEDERAKINDDWKEKQLAVLTAEQRTRYEKELAQAPQRQEEAVAQESPASPAAGGSEATSTEAGTQTAAVPDGVTPVMSFGGGVDGERKLISEFSFNFRFAPWEQVLLMFADGSDLTLDLVKIPPGTFNHLDDKKYSAKEALDIINGKLLRQGYGMFEKEGFLIVINLDDGIPPSLLRDVSVEELLSVDPVKVGNNELVNLTMEVAEMDTAKAAQEIEALVGPWGSMIALTESNILILTDIGSNLRRIQGLLTIAMSKAKPDTQMFTMYPLKYMDVEEAELAVMTQFGMRKDVGTVRIRQGKAKAEAFSSG